MKLGPFSGCVFALGVMVDSTGCVRMNLPAVDAGARGGGTSQPHTPSRFAVPGAPRTDPPTDGERAILERMKMRGLTGAESAADILLRAKTQADRLPELPTSPAERDGGIWSWNWLGPSNIGGPARAFVMDGAANALWLWAAGGGIWRSTNGGASWQPLTDWLPSLSVSALLRDPVTRRLWAGTGEMTGSSAGWPGAGIFISDNDGDTWSSVASTSAWKVARLAQSSDRSYLLAGTDVGLHRSSDGGATWTRVGPGMAAVPDVECHPTDSNFAIAGQFDGVVLRSADRGITWTATTTFSSGQRVELAYAPNQPTTIYASVNRNGGEIWRSTNGGVSFSLRNTGQNYFVGAGNQGNYDNALWVSPSNSQHVVVGGIDLWISTGGGSNLTKISDWALFHNPGISAHADQHLIVHHPNYTLGTRRVFVLNDGGIQTTPDILADPLLLNLSWSKLNNGLGITQFYTVAAGPGGGDVVLGGTQDNSFLRYNDGDPTSGWVQPTTGDGAYCAIDHADPTLRYASTQFLRILRAGFGSDIYTERINGLFDAGDPDRAAFIAPFAMAPTLSNRLIAGGAAIWRTDNGGGDWLPIRAPMSFDEGFRKCTAVAIGPNNSNLVWVGYDSGEVARTTSAFGSATWTVVDINGLPGSRPVTSIAISPANSNHVYVSLGGYIADPVWFTPDAGATWISRSGSGDFVLPTIQVNSVAIHPDNANWIYVGTDLGLFASEDGGQRWNRTPRFGPHEGPVNVEVSMVAFDDAKSLYAATHGRGIYKVRPRVKIYIDRLAGTFGAGTEFAPFLTILEGIEAAGPGATLSIKAEDYNEPWPLLFNRRMLIETTERTPGGGARVIIR